jgi:ATP-dependent DNA ligase
MSFVFRYPDDPRRISQDYLKKLEDKSKPGDLIGQFKWDDWRLMATKASGAWRFFAKRGSKEDRSKQPPEDLRRQLHSLELPDGTTLDMGWVGPRDPFKVLKGRHFLVVWDLMCWEGKWQGEFPYHFRLSNLRAIVTPRKHAAKADLIEIAESRVADLSKMFEESKAHPEYEGIVVKRANSKLVGGWAKAEDNPSWWKVKYRDIKEPTAF